jgi:hypothetical protein
MWPSTIPPTRPYSVAPFVGVPVACRPASGNSAQPVAGANVTVATGLPVDCGTSRNVSPPAPSTAKSAAGLGTAAAARLPSACAVT